MFDVYERWMLGYEFRKRGKKIIVEKHIYQPKSYYHEWHPCVVQKVNKEYHITKAGIMNKKDYALLFETENEKHHIPVEATEQIDVYNDIVLTGSVIRTLSNENIRLGIYDKYGDLLGYFTPERYGADSKTVLAQCKEYNDEKQRLKISRKMEIAAIHNVRANLRYYNKQTDKDLDEYIDNKRSV